jgi:hypothetical protein
MGATPWNRRFAGSKRFLAPPPVDHPGEQSTYRHGGEADQSQLHRKPSPSGDALGPGEAEGAGLELAGDEGRAEEEPDECRRDRDDERQGTLQQRVDLEHRVRRRGAVSRYLAGALECVVHVCQVRAGDGEHDGEHGERAEANDYLRAELAQRQANHGRTSSFSRRSPWTARVM